MPRPPHSPCLDLTNDNWGWVRTRRLKEKFLRPFRGSNFDRQVVQPVARHYTEIPGSQYRLYTRLFYEAISTVAVNGRQIVGDPEWWIGRDVEGSGRELS
jgi:hypothetical protein